jgi:hypothetical protein
MIAGAIADIRKLFLDAKPLPHPPGRSTFLVETAPPAEVLLHPGALSLLRGASGLQAGGLVGVWLENTETGIAVHAEGGQVGVIRDEGVPAYLPITRAAEEKGAVAVLPAVLSEERGREPRLRLGVSIGLARRLTVSAPVGIGEARAYCGGLYAGLRIRQAWSLRAPEPE